MADRNYTTPDHHLVSETESLLAKLLRIVTDECQPADLRLITEDALVELEHFYDALVWTRGQTG